MFRISFALAAILALASFGQTQTVSIHEPAVVTLPSACVPYDSPAVLHVDKAGLTYVGCGSSVLVYNVGLTSFQQFVIQTAATSPSTTGGGSPCDPTSFFGCGYVFAGGTGSSTNGTTVNGPVTAITSSTDPDQAFLFVGVKNSNGALFVLKFSKNPTSPVLRGSPVLTQQVTKESQDGLWVLQAPDVSGATVRSVKTNGAIVAILASPSLSGTSQGCTFNCTNQQAPSPATLATFQVR